LDIGAHTFLKPNGAVTRQPAARSDLSGFDALDGISAANEPAAAAPAPAAPAGKVRVTLPNAPQAPAAQQAAEPNGFDALEKIASAADPKAVEGMPAGDGAAAVGAGIINGIPVAGPYVMDKVQRGLATVRSFQSGQPYEGELAAVKKFTGDTMGENPGATSFGNVLGGVTATLPIAATGVGAAALGMRGALGTRFAAGAASGAGIGAADAVARGEDVGYNALLGAGAGGATPLVAKAIGAVAAPVVNKLTSLTQNSLSGASRANNALLSAVEAGGQDTTALRAELTRNPNLALADLNPALREQVVGLAQGGPQAAEVQSWVAGRRGAAGGQVRSAFDDAIGAAPDPVALKEQLAATAKANAKAGFGAAMKDAKPVDLSGLSNSTVGRINDATERALSTFTDDARAALSQPEKLHLAQQQLRREAEALSSSAVGSERLSAGDLRNVRSQLVDRIDAATGGKFKPAQAQFADDMSVREAFDRGADFRKARTGSAGVDDTVVALKREFAAMTEPEREAYRQGARVEIQRVMDAARNPARAGEALTDAEIHRGKLEVAFGKKETDKLLQAVEDTRRMADTNNRVFGGSDTAQRTAARETVKVRGESAPATELGVPALAGIIGGPGAAAAVVGSRLAGKGANALLQGAQRSADLTRNRLLANDLTRSGSEGAQVLNRLDQFLSQRKNAPRATSAAISQNAPLNLLIRAGGQRAYSP
jgi:hypothetical protein